jgi:hypothetical protein
VAPGYRQENEYSVISRDGRRDIVNFR